MDQLNIDVDEFQRRSLIQLKTEKEQEKIEKLNSEVKTLEDGEELITEESFIYGNTAAFLIYNN